MSERSKICDLSTLKSILLLLGAYAFSYCLGLTFHETGHALAYLIVGVSDIEIHVHPFALSHCSHGFRPTEVLPFTGCMGPLFNILCSSIITLVVWHKRNPKLLPLVMCAGTAFIAEGVAIIIDIAGLPRLTDWGKVIIIGGVSPIIMGIISVLFLVIGSIILLLILPLVNISSHDPYLRRVLISIGFILYFIFSVIYVSIFDLNVLDNRMIALFSAIGFNFLLMALYKPAFPFLDRLSHTDTSIVNWSAVAIAFGSALTIIVIDLVFF